MPPLPFSAECAMKLRDAMFGGITEHDMADIMKTFVAKAKGGDEKAAKLVFDVVNQSAPQVSVKLKGQPAQPIVKPYVPPPLPAPPVIKAASLKAAPSVAVPDGEDEDDDDSIEVPELDEDMKRTLRMDAAKAMRNGPLTLKGLAEVTMFDPRLLEAALSSSDWFKRDGEERWRLTEYGRKEAR